MNLVQISRRIVNLDHVVRANWRDSRLILTLSREGAFEEFDGDEAQAMWTIMAKHLLTVQGNR